jgi:hypothetical protein
MAILIIITEIGLILSGAVHLCVLWNVFSWPAEFFIKANLALLLSYILIRIISRTLYHGIIVSDFFKALANTLPFWMKIITGTILLYGIIVIVYFSCLSDIENGFKVNKGASALTMILYAAELALLHVYWVLRNTNSKSHKLSVLCKIYPAVKSSDLQ